MDPALLQQILGAGPLAEQQTANEQQLQDLIARRRAYQPSQRTTGLGSLFSGIGDIIMGNKFNEGEQQLRAQQADLSGKMAGLRGQYGNALLGTPMGPAATPGMPDNPPRIPLSPEDQGQLSMAAEMSGDPLMAKAGAGALTRAQQAPKLALETEQARRAQQENAAMDSPEAGMVLRALAGKYGAQVPEKTPSAVLRALMPTLEKGYAAGEGKFAVHPLTGQIYDTRTGRTPGGGNAGSGGPATISPEMLDALARQYAQTGEMPQLRMGRAGIAIYPQILKRAAELHPELDLAGAKAGYHADTASLAGLTKQADAMNSFEGTALRNLDTFLNAAKGVVDTGSPLFNAPARAFAQKVAGDPKMTAFNVSRQVAVQEISKVLGGSLGNAAVSDSARHEVAGLIGPDASLAQIFEAARILKLDMANRKASVAEQIATVRGRAGGKAQTPAEASPAAPTDMVDVISPEGKAGKIPAAKLDAALKRGFKRAGSQ